VCGVIHLLFFVLHHTCCIQVYSATDSAADTRQLIVHRMSMVRSAMPLFTDHLQLPLFTGHRRWHTMFGQLNQLTPSCCAETPALNVDEDILADSNFVSLFDSSPDSECHDAVEPVNDVSTRDMQAPYQNIRASCMTAESLQTLEESRELSVMDLTESDFPALDENEDGVQSAVQQFILDANVDWSDQNANCESSTTNQESSHDLAVNLPAHNVCSSHEYACQCVDSLTASVGSYARTLHGRRHSDPGSVSSGTTGSQSTNSNSDNWYYYDRRLGPGGVLNAQYSRLRTQRSLSVIVFPPAYDDAVYNAPASLTVDQHRTDNPSEQLLTVSDTTCENTTEQPPPYQESELPPAYSEVSDTADENEQLDSEVSPASSTYHEYSWQPSCGQNLRAGEGSVMTTRCTNSHAVFVGRPAVRWNRNTSVDQWTSSFNWVMS